MTVEKYFTEILKIILAMTFTGSIISIFLFAIKPIIKNKLPKSFQYCMWFPAILPEDVKCYWNVAMAYDVFFRGYGFSQFLHTSQCHIR